jgi:putative endonuclease
MPKTCCIYNLASMSRALYVGMTSDLDGRLYQHKHGTLGGFTAKYKVNRLVYFAEYENPNDATARER